MWCFPCPNSEAFSTLIKILAQDQKLLETLGSKRPGIVFHCSGIVVQTLCDQKQTGSMFRCSRACLLPIRPKSEPAQTARFPSALSLWILSATVTFRAFLLWAGPSHQCGLRTSPAVPAPPSPALLSSNAKAGHLQNSFPGQPSSLRGFIHLPTRQHPSFIPDGCDDLLLPPSPK